LAVHVPVTRNDEFGVMAQYTNTMISELHEPHGKCRKLGTSQLLLSPAWPKPVTRKQAPI
jgi:hypothetical protein